jgi:hypothetical protein
MTVRTSHKAERQIWICLPGAPEEPQERGAYANYLYPKSLTTYLAIQWTI